MVGGHFVDALGALPAGLAGVEVAVLGELSGEELPFGDFPDDESLDGELPDEALADEAFPDDEPPDDELVCEAGAVPVEAAGAAVEGLQSGEIVFFL